jgi:DNA (cytosine-5)-methyltransferase 1
MRVLDLFSGIGGFSIGLERAGMRTVAFCEIDPYCRKVLARHWPGVPCHDDVTTLTVGQLPAGIDVICGGFPCQDISHAGKGAGITGERSGLWKEYARIIGEVRPRYVIVENVAALLSRGLADVLGDLAAIGYDAEWHCIPASAVGAPHRRDRIWIVAYPGGSGSQGSLFGSQPGDQAALVVAGCGEAISDPNATRYGERLRWAIGDGNRWEPEPDVGRVADGVPARVDRLKALGNAVVPQIPELIGRAIMATD